MSNMKKVLLSIVFMASIMLTANAQSIIDAEDGRNPNDFYIKVDRAANGPFPTPACEAMTLYGKW